jgi:hypothetical protein
VKSAHNNIVAITLCYYNFSRLHISISLKMQRKEKTVFEAKSDVSGSECAICGGKLNTGAVSSPVGEVRQKPAVSHEGKTRVFVSHL